MATKFTVQWARRTPPAGYVYDTQIKRPGGNSVMTQFPPGRLICVWYQRTRLGRSSGAHCTVNLVPHG